MIRQRCKLFSALFMGALVLLVAFDGKAATVTFDAVADGGKFPADAEVVAATLAQRQFGDDTDDTLAQSVTVDNAFTLKSIYLAFESDTRLEEDETATMTIFKVADVNAAIHDEPPLAADILLTDTVTFPYVAGADTVAHIVLDTPLELPASVGTSGYAVHFAGTTNPGWEWLRTGSAFGNIYADGSGYEAGSEKGAGASGRDFTLALSSVVPEPSSMLLCVLGTGICLASRRRQQLSRNA